MNSVPYIFWAILESVVILVWGPRNFQFIPYDQAPRCPDWTILGQVLRGGVQILLYLSQKYFTSSLLYLLNSKVRIESCIFNSHSQPKAIAHIAIYQVLQFTTYINPIETWVCNLGVQFLTVTTPYVFLVCNEELTTCEFHLLHTRKNDLVF